jgi:hypothetical protein
MVTLDEIDKIHTWSCKYVQLRYSLITITKVLDALKAGRATRTSLTKTEDEIKTIKNAQNVKNENVAGSVWLSLLMNGTVKLQYTPPSTELSRIQHLIMVMVNFWI